MPNQETNELRTARRPGPEAGTNPGETMDEKLQRQIRLLTDERLEAKRVRERLEQLAEQQAERIGELTEENRQLRQRLAS